MAKRKRKRSDRHHHHHHHSKNSSDRSRRQKRKNGFWIDTCQESQSVAVSKHHSVPAALSVILTQVNLTDNHLHGTRDNVHANKNKEDSGKSQAGKESIGSTESNGRRAKDKDETHESSKIAAEASPSLTLPQDVNPKNNSDDSHEIDVPYTDQKTHETSGVQASNESAQDVFISISRAQSAKQSPPKFPKVDFKPLPHGDCGDGIVNPHPDVDDKYWAQRKRLFDRFDEGIQLDTESWYSVTPQAIARHIADRVVRACSGRTNLVVLDAFCGCGGNAIAFAQREEVSLVVCVDVDRTKLNMAAHNAALYNIPPNKLLFLHDNAVTVLETMEKRYSGNEQSIKTTTTKLGRYTLNASLPTSVDCIFLSPPWGGMNYAQVGKENYTLKDSIQIANPSNEETSMLNGEELLERSARVQSRVVYFLPRNTNGIALGRSAVNAGYSGQVVELEKNVLNDKFKTITAYFGMPLMDTLTENEEVKGASRQEQSDKDS